MQLYGAEDDVLEQKVTLIITRTNIYILCITLDAFEMVMQLAVVLRCATVVGDCISRNASGYNRPSNRDENTS